MVKSIIIFSLSVFSVLILLSLERAVGIGWDYHRDSITYAEDSFAIVDGILSQGIMSIPNGGYYFITSFFNQDIYLITTYNIFLFSLTNVYFAKLHWRITSDHRRLITFILLFLLFNPYRMHLASTLLKDTTVIFLMSLVFYYFPKNKVMALTIFFPLFLVRIVSVVYLAILVPLRYWKYLIIPVLVLAFLFPDILVERLDASNDVSLKNREYDNMPTFQEFGYLGSLIRGLVWPFLALTGTFLIFTPALAFLFVALGSFMNMVYVWKVARTTPITLYVYAPMFILAVLAPGFASYIRYVYPLVALSPLIVLFYQDPNRERIN